jgi:hypothetical protein
MGNRTDMLIGKGADFGANVERLLRQTPVGEQRVGAASGKVHLEYLCCRGLKIERPGRHRAG